jgi:hypothetical protein
VAAEPASPQAPANEDPVLQTLIDQMRPAGSRFLSEAAPDLAKGLLLNGALTFGADRALQRSSSDPRSGVALGASSAFAIAPIVRNHYGWAAGASAYALAAATGTYVYTRDGGSRSSVLLGSALGLAVGEAVALHSSRARELKDHLILGHKGLGLRMRF